MIVNIMTLETGLAPVAMTEAFSRSNASASEADHRRESVAATLRAARQHRATGLDEPASKQVVAAYGLRVPDGRVVADADTAVAAFDALGPPVVAKLTGAGTHKSDLGGVRLNLQSAAAVRHAFAVVSSAATAHGLAGDRVLIERMSAPGHEVVLGGFLDPRFGPVLMLGTGGIFVELLADAVFRICPIDARDAAEMIEGLRSLPLLRGARGGIRIDEAALVEALLRIGGPRGLLVEQADRLAELDLNPVIANADGVTACDARIILRPEPTATGNRRPDRDARDRSAALDWEPLFSPRSMAVIGASGNAVTVANDFIRQSLALGYKGRIVPVHPSAATIEGLPTAPSLAAAGEYFDYVYIAVSAAQVPAIIRSAAGIARFAQVISSGFGEVSHGVGLERELAQACRESGVRTLGPNCLGLYSPRGGLAFIGDCPPESGPVGIISQSGGLAVDVILRGRTLGIRYSGLVTLGNSVDVGPADLLEYFLADPRTRVIGVYVEDVKEGRRFFDVLHEARAKKPVVLLIGGQTGQGQRAAASHTGSLATPMAIWQGLAEQTGAVLAETLDQFLDQLMTFQLLDARRGRPTRRCVLFGNGGGTSVLAADAFARRQLDVSPLPGPALAALEALGLPSGTSVVNPIDAPAFTLRQEDGRIAERILEIVCESGEPDAVITHLNLPVFVSSANQQADFLTNLTQATLRVQGRFPGRAHFALVLRSDGSEICEARKRAFRQQAVGLGVPVYDELSNAAIGLSALARYERFLDARGC